MYGFFNQLKHILAKARASAEARKTDKIFYNSESTLKWVLNALMKAFQNIL